jgi:cytidine deaminase
LAGFPETRLSVTMIDVAEGHEAAFQTLARELSALMARKEYGRIDVVRDESGPLRFYLVRQWASTASAQLCHADPETQSIFARLAPIARLLHLVNGVTGREAFQFDERRAYTKADRRLGFDRRVKDDGRSDGDRRSHTERRVGSRRARDQSGEADLVGAARRAREHAEARFSNFKVGAALESVDGTVITGCNVENATYGLTICAERVAVFKALSEGHRAFKRIAIVADTDTLTPPCGACRQILWEFGGNLEVILANLKDGESRHMLKNLLPLPFDARLL